MFSPQVAMLLKKRIFVYAETVAELLPIVRSFPIVCYEIYLVIYYNYIISHYLTNYLQLDGLASQ